MTRVDLLNYLFNAKVEQPLRSELEHLRVVFSDWSNLFFSRRRVSRLFDSDDGSVAMSPGVRQENSRDLRTLDQE